MPDWGAFSPGLCVFTSALIDVRPTKMLSAWPASNRTMWKVSSVASAPPDSDLMNRAVGRLKAVGTLPAGFVFNYGPFPLDGSNPEAP